MAQPTNLFDRFAGTKAVRESLANIIYNISPEDTPFLSTIGKESVGNTFFEWQTDQLAAANTSNWQIEGDDATLDARVATNRVGNYTQISRKVIGVSQTVEAVDKAGMKSYLAYEIAKASSELKRDMEAMLLNNQAAAVGSSSVARRTAAFPAWLRTNTSKGVGGVDPTLSSGSDGYPNAARTDGTQRNLTETILNDAIQQVWTQGGNPVAVLLGPVNKRKASAFAGIATNRVSQNSGDGIQPFAIVASADIYLSDFGKVSFVPSRFQRERDAFVIDPEYASVAYLRDFQTADLAKTGDSTRKMLICEYGLKVKTEKSHAIIADLNIT
jgi:hypothetical protein